MSTHLKILIGQTQAGKGVGFDLAALITTRALIQANSGAGKSYLLRALMEQLFPHIQIICIDPEGEFASLREKYPFVLVGKDGDTAADVRTAGLLAERLLELNTSAICDLYEMKVAERHVWVKNFLNAMVMAPKKLWHPVIVMVDEAQMFCPQKGAGESVASGAMVDLASLGRKRGFCAVWATQRLAKVDKDATSLLQNRLIGGTFEDVDIKRVLDLLSVAQEDKKAFTHQLRTLDPGWFYAFGRAIAKERVLFKSRKVETTHASAGSGKHSAAPPPPPEKVRELLPRLADLPKEAAERTATLEDLKKQLRTVTLELQQAKRAQPAPTKTDPKAIEKAVQYGVAPLRRLLEDAMKIMAKITAEGFDKTGLKDEEVRKALESATAQIVKLAETRVTARNRELEVLRKQLASLEYRVKAALGKAEEEIAVNVHVKHNEPFTVKPGTDADKMSRLLTRVRTQRAAGENNGDASSLPGTSRKLLGILAQWSPQGMRRGQLASFAGIKSSTGSFSNRLTDLRGPGYIREEGDLVFATEEGIAALGGDIPDAPATTEEVMAVWRPRLPGTSYRILEKLVEAGGDPVARVELAEAIGIKADTGSFSNRLTDLRTAGLMVDVDKGRVAAKKEALFLEGVYA